MSPEHDDLFQRAMSVIADQELSYADDWSSDADTLMGRGFYDFVSKIVDPQDDEMIVDVGTGTGIQLLALASTNPRARYIGTERTRANVMGAFTRLKEDGLDKYFAALAISELRGTNDRKAYWWRNLEYVRQMRASIRAHLAEKLLLIDDNILYPEVLPAILDGEKIDAGILSMPGGSSARAIEWPLDPGTHAGVPQEELRRRIFDISNTTRHAFYHFMSENVRTDGRIVIAERMVRHPDVSAQDAAMSLVGRHMKQLARYWKPKGGAFMETPLTGTSVALRASDADGKDTVEFQAGEGNNIGVVILRVDRNNVRFDEKPLPRPKEA